MKTWKMEEIFMGFVWHVKDKRGWDFKMVKIERTFFDFGGLFQVEKNP